MIRSLQGLLDQWPATTGAGMTVALLDSGVEASHPDFRDAKIDGVVLGLDGDRVVSTPYQGEDVAGHGTACAGRILSIAPQVRIFSCQVLSSSSTTTSRLLLGALEWLLLRDDIDVVNLSIGTPNRALGLEIGHAVDRFHARGIPLVASAGPEERPDYPAVFSGPVSVTSGKCSSDSEIQFRPGELVEFAARGHDVEVPWRGGKRVMVTGSSFAAPLIAGRMARFKSLRRDLTVWELKTLLQHQACIDAQKRP
ncbi:hypothetical protein BH09SUM1_BH09SUM1_32420 [soil metagenome]